MPFAKGQSGNPGGRATEKVWRDAVRRAVHRLVSDPPIPNKKLKLIDAIAQSLATKAAAGDVQAAKEIGDRLDGKSTQPISGDSEGGPINIRWLTANEAEK